MATPPPKPLLPLLFFSLSLSLSLCSAQSSPIKSAYWAFATEFPITSIDSSYFTHLFAAFASLDSSTNTLSLPSSSFSSFTSTVRSSNPSVLTLLSIGGGSADPSTFSSMASSASSRKTFINSAISLARSNNFNGLDLDWESPASQSDMSNLAALFSEWRAAIKAEAASSGKPQLLLTAAVSVSSSVNGVKYPISSIAANLDWVNVMDYDFYAPKRTHVTAAHAALYDPSGGPSGSAGVNDWLSAGLGTNMIVLGLPYYGYAWNLTDPNNHGLGAPADPNGPAVGPGIYAGDGSIGYDSVRDFIANNNAVTVYDSKVVVNYCYAGRTWIGYDDVESIGAKVAYAKGKGLRGYFAWSVSGDGSNWVLSKKAQTTWG